MEDGRSDRPIGARMGIKRKVAAIAAAAMAVVGGIVGVGGAMSHAEDGGAGGGATGGGGGQTVGGWFMLWSDGGVPGAFIHGTGRASDDWFIEQLSYHFDPDFSGSAALRGLGYDSVRDAIHGFGQQARERAAARARANGHAEASADQSRVVGLYVAFANGGGLMGVSKSMTAERIPVPTATEFACPGDTPETRAAVRSRGLEDAFNEIQGSPLVIVWARNQFEPQASYELKIATQASWKWNDATSSGEPIGTMAAGNSTDFVYDHVETTVTKGAAPAGEKLAAKITLHYEGYGTNKGKKVTKDMTLIAGKPADSPYFKPEDFGWTRRKAWAAGEYYFTIEVDKGQSKLLDNDPSMRGKEPSETFIVAAVESRINKGLYDETNERDIEERVESLVYDMDYWAQIEGVSLGSNDMWIRDVIDTIDVRVDDASSFVTSVFTDRVPAEIHTTQKDGKTITIAHIKGDLQPGDKFTLNVLQTPTRKSDKEWKITDVGGMSEFGDDKGWVDTPPHTVKVIPHRPDKVWVLGEDGALTASDKDWTNAVSDVEKGHADEKTFLVGDPVSAVVNGKISKSYVDNLKRYAISDDVSPSAAYIDWDLSKTKVFIDGKDRTSDFDIARNGNVITATMKTAATRTALGDKQRVPGTQLAKADRQVKLFISGNVAKVGDSGETIRVTNGGSEDINGDDVKSNVPGIFLWAPKPDKAWVKLDEATGKWRAVIDPDWTNHAANSGDDCTFLDGDAVGSVVNGIVPAGTALAIDKLALGDDWTESDYLVDPDGIEGVRVYEADIDVHKNERGGVDKNVSTSSVDDIVNNGRDVTKFFTIAFNSTDMAKATSATATAKPEYLQQLRNLDKARQITLVIPMHARYAHGKGAEQVRKDYGVNPQDEVVMTNRPDGKQFSNVASETLNGGVYKTNVPWIHGYVPPTPKEVLGAADNGGGQEDIDGKKVQPGETVEYKLTTFPNIPANMAYDIKVVRITDKYDELLTVSKQTLELTDLHDMNIIPRSCYKVTWDDEAHEFSIELTDKRLIDKWRVGGGSADAGKPRLMVRFEATVASEEDIPASRKEADDYVHVLNQWELTLNNSVTPSNIPEVLVPPFDPVKADVQSEEQGDPAIDIDGKTFLNGDTGEYRLTLDATKLDDAAYSVWRLGLVDDYDDEYLEADASKVRVLDEGGKDVTDKFNIQIVDGVLYVFAKLVDTTVPSTQVTIKATQPEDLAKYAASDEHDVERDPAIDQSLLGQAYTVVMPFRVAKVVDGYVVKNEVTQVVNDRRHVSNQVSNPLKPIQPEKDVTIDVGGESIDGQEVKLNSLFNYKLMSGRLPVDRAYGKVTDWSIEDQLDEKYDRYTGQWVVIAAKDVYDGDKVLFHEGDVIAESVAYHAAKAAEAAKKAKAEKTEAAKSEAKGDEKAGDKAEAKDGKDAAEAKGDKPEAKDGKDAKGTITPDAVKAAAARLGLKGVDGLKADDMAMRAIIATAGILREGGAIDADAIKAAAKQAASDLKADADAAELAAGLTPAFYEAVIGGDADGIPQALTVEEGNETYVDGKGKKYFEATYKDGKYVISATEDFLKLVSDDTKESGWDAYIQCERVWVTDRHENVFTETINGIKRESNVVWTKTPENPAIDVEKYDVKSGMEEGDRDVREQALTVEGDTEIGFKITNTGDVRLDDVTLEDVTIGGTGTVEDIRMPEGFDGTLEPGESVTAFGVLRGVQPGTDHADTATARGKSHYSGKVVEDKDDWHGVAPAMPQTGDAVAGVAAAMATVAAGVGVAAFARRRARR